MARGTKNRKGAGRKPEFADEMKMISLRLPRTAIVGLDAYAQKYDLSRPKALVRLLNEVGLIEIMTKDNLTELKPQTNT